MPLTENDINWIEFLVGKITVDELTLENYATRLSRQMDRQDVVDRGDIPLKPFPGGIVDAFGEDD